MTFEEIISQWSALPASRIARDVNQALQSHTSLVVSAPPGAGKSTLLPLTVWTAMADSGRVVMLEPRRLAARQIAERMAAMLGERVGQTVGYRVRFDTCVSEHTRIEVVTEGILTRMLVDDATLEDVGVVIFDEFHERSINSDLALAMARLTQQTLRPDLRLMVMSATIDDAGIAATLQAPVVNSEGRMFAVEVHHAAADTPPRDVAADVARAICQAHRQHEGDILAFLPGQADIERCRQLLADGLWPTAVCPLFGHLSPEEQRRAIAASAAGERKVVLATAIAETSVTIEGVRVVIDSGFTRALQFDSRNGLSHLETVRISRDMATQRQGRAGRVAEGVCYRLYTAATCCQMADHRQPEILSADLAPMVLAIAVFGEADPLALPWLTPPPAAEVKKAQGALQMLGALHADGTPTALGRRMAAMPCHPRIARMMLSAETPAAKALAADIAAVLEERDPLADSGADICLRIEQMRRSRRAQSAGRWSRMAQVAAEYRRMMHVDADNADFYPQEAGRLIARAYPERIARAEGHTGRYRLAGGDYAQLDMSDVLTSHEWLAIASLHAQPQGGRVFLAAPLAADDLELRQTDRAAWDSREQRVALERQWRVGRLVVRTAPLQHADREMVVRIICEAVAKDGLSMLDWDDRVQALQRRVQTVAEWHPELSLPDLSTPTLLATAAEWLPFYLDDGGRLRTTQAELKKIVLADVLWALVPYDLQQQVDRLAPTHIVVSTGSRIRIDYRAGAAAPVLSVRLQECFGMQQTPCVDDGRRPLLMELLSPGFRPVQLTQDLASFWANAYFDVRKDLRRRYPKHYWPENPLEAEAVRGVKRR